MPRFWPNCFAASTSSSDAPASAAYSAGRWAACRMVCPKADGADGYLDICIVSTKYKWRLLLIMLASIFGKHVTHTGVHLYRCREAVIHTDRALPVHVDGESIGEQTDYTLTCIPKKLRLRL